MATWNPGTGDETAGRRPRLMVAEDDPDMAHVLQFLLRREGYDVETVADGRDAVARLSAEPPLDMIIVDVMMPFVNGIEVVRKLRASSSSAWVPALVISGKSSEEDVVEALEAGASDYLTKPFRPKEMVARVRSLLEGRRATRRVVA